MDKMIDTINERAMNAEEIRWREEEAARYAERNRKMLQEQKLQRARKRATRGTILKAILTLALCVALWLAMGAGWVAQPLAFLCMALALAWLCFHIGAYVQYFYFAKGGLLHGQD